MVFSTIFALKTDKYAKANPKYHYDIISDDVIKMKIFFKKIVDRFLTTLKVCFGIFVRFQCQNVRKTAKITGKFAILGKTESKRGISPKNFNFFFVENLLRNILKRVVKFFFCLTLAVFENRCSKQTEKQTHILALFIRYAVKNALLTVIRFEGSCIDPLYLVVYVQSNGFITLSMNSFPIL